MIVYKGACVIMVEIWFLIFILWYVRQLVMIHHILNILLSTVNMEFIPDCHYNSRYI